MALLRSLTDAENDALLALRARLDGLLWLDERLFLQEQKNEETIETIKTNLQDQPFCGHGRHGRGRPTQQRSGQQLLWGNRPENGRRKRREASGSGGRVLLEQAGAG